jgi:hypothetical protein
MRSIVVGVLCVLSLLTGAKAQVANLSERELDALLSESMLNEEAGSSLILDNTRTKIGREFYENFFREWSSASSDTLVVSAFIAALNPEDFTITIDELPSFDGLGMLKTTMLFRWRFVHCI